MYVLVDIGPIPRVVTYRNAIPLGFSGSIVHVKHRLVVAIDEDSNMIVPQNDMVFRDDCTFVSQDLDGALGCAYLNLLRVMAKISSKQRQCAERIIGWRMDYE